ncbi:hypothetical protein AALO_G00132320 [Alosa alosa]|uniref:Uncharacterized protein n=1 Tax=Alosa alosa TaxID=278164 RepID=A0AAV6GUA6_9TELE|nr:hypothetical protein AALO_G00132320 [Alosa alosa]
MSRLLAKYRCCVYERKRGYFYSYAYSNWKLEEREKGPSSGETTRVTVTMGSFKGHILPGSFFLIAGLWWAGKYSLWYATRRNKSAGAGRLATRAMQRRMEILEGAVVLSFSLIGILAEQFVASGPRFHLFDPTQQQWAQLMIWQHSTMYLFFALSGATTLAIHVTDVAPLALDRLMLAIAFFNEGFLFMYHLHGRDMLDVHVHQLLLSQRVLAR